MNIKVGRINNLLTVVNVIDRLLCDRPYGDIVSALGNMYVRFEQKILRVLQVV